MKKIIIALSALFLTLYLTAFFYLTPSNVIEIINGYLPALNIRSDDNGGNILTGFSFKNLHVVKGKDEILSVHNLKLNINYLPLITGRVGIKIKSDEVGGDINFTFWGTLDGEISIKGLYFDTASFGIKEDVQFSSQLEGKLTITKGDALLEIKTDELNWRKLTVTGVDLPFTLFSTARGGILFSKDRIVIKSINFEGPKGNARIVGEIVSGTPKLELEIMPKDWQEPYLIPLEQYKTGPGFYKIPLSI